MCVLAFAWQAHPRWRLVMIGNRDELHARPASALAAWDDVPHVIAGRDKEAGGTWLGVSTQGRIAAVTNLPNPQGRDPDAASRGTLVSDILAGTGQYADPSAAQLDHFSPFNLFTADEGGARLMTNRPEPEIRNLTPAIYGLSNSPFDAPWPKAERICDMLSDWMDDSDSDHQAMLDGLRADDSPQVEPGEAHRSPIFILNPIYGTRCSTICSVDADGNGLITERQYDEAGVETGETELSFRWDG